MSKYYKIIFLFFLLNGFALFVKAQSEHPSEKIVFSFYGKVTDSNSKQSIGGAVITIPALQLWAITDNNGNFSIPELKKGEYLFEVSILGYRKKSERIIIDEHFTGTTIPIEAQSLSLDEITVTAKEKKTGSTSIISETSIQHIQAKSIRDFLQLVPGNLTTNPNLNTAGQAYIREISGSNNNAMGTSVLVDGVPLSNDANLQITSTSRDGTSFSSQTTAGRGIDLRSISPDNVESVEIVRGIAGVEYGNLTSGAIIIKTKAGQTPLELKAKTDEYSKMFYSGKGFSLGDNAGWLNLSLDYSQSYSDIRLKYEGYERITSNIGYSNVFMKSGTPLSFNLRFAYFRNVNNEKADPQMKSEERINNKNEGYRASVEGNWRLNKKLISSLEYSFVISQSHQSDYSNEFKTLHTGITPISDSYIDGEFLTRYLNASFYMESWVDGRPANAFGQIKANKLIQFNAGAFTNIKIGADWRYDVNKGEGLIFDPLFPPIDYRTVQTLRPRSYKAVPPMNVLSVFVEDKLQVPIGATLLSLQGGVRFSNMFVHQSAKRQDIFTAEPRVNAFLQVLDKSNNTVFDDLSIVGAYGISSKMPALLHLYPDKAYFDERSFAYMKGDLSGAVAVITTKVIDDTSNPSLKPTISKKTEFGLVSATKKMQGNITFFYEKTKNEYGFSSLHFVMPYNSYSVPTNAEDVFYTGGMLYYMQGSAQYPASVTKAKDFQTYLYPNNTTETEKKGIEYSIDFGQLPVIKTSLVVDGAWLHIKRYSTQQRYSEVTTSYEGGKYPYIAVMPAGSGSIESRLNTNFRFITHIPALKMVFSTTAQVVWFEQSQVIYQNAEGQNLYYKTIDPQSSSQDERYFVNPVGFWDKDNNYHEWKNEYADEYKYRLMIGKYSHTNYFGIEKYPINIILNFRLTKEFGDIMDFSFIANNFLNFSTMHKYTTSQGYSNLSLPMYAGAEIKIKIH